MKKILILYLKAGQGHLSIGRAIRDSLAEHHPDKFECFLEDALYDKDRWAQFLLQDVYKIISTYMLPIYALVYYGSYLKMMYNMHMKSVLFHSKEHIKKLLDEYHPELVVITHPLLVRSVKMAIKECRSPVHPMVLNTILDLDPAPWCYEDREFLSVVSTPEIYRTAIKKYRLAPERLAIIPPPLRKQFYETYDAARVRGLKLKYGFDPDKKTVVIASGGNGLPKAIKIAFELVRRKTNVNLAIVCGRNRFQQRILELLVKRNPWPGQCIRVFGFIEYISEILALSDIIISKAGFSGVFEALTLKKVLIISSYIWGQEHGNAEFIRKNRLGFVIKDPAEVARAVNKLLVKPHITEYIVKNIENMNFGNGSREIADYLVSLFEKRSATAKGVVHGT